MTYEEYKLNEILKTGQTVIETYLAKDEPTDTFSYSETSMYNELEGGDAFVSLGTQMFKYTNRNVEHPKLLYSILVQVHTS